MCRNISFLNIMGSQNSCPNHCSIHFLHSFFNGLLWIVQIRNALPSMALICHLSVRINTTNRRRGLVDRGVPTFFLFMSSKKSLQQHLTSFIAFQKRENFRGNKKKNDLFEKIFLCFVLNSLVFFYNWLKEILAEQQQIIHFKSSVVQHMLRSAI